MYEDEAQPETDLPLVSPWDVISLDANVDGTGGTLSGKPVWSLEQVIANLNRTSYPGTGIPGPSWSYGTDFLGQNKSGDPMVIQYGFYTAQSQLFQIPYVYPNAAGTGLVGRIEYFQFGAFSAAQQAAANKAIALWDDLIKVSFVQVSDINQADVARLVGLTPPAFSRFFRRATGQTFVGFVNILRINEVCRAMLEGSECITNIAMRCGYNNIANFNRQFLAQKGMNPSQYRERHQRLRQNAKLFAADAIAPCRAELATGAT